MPVEVRYQGEGKARHIDEIVVSKQLLETDRYGAGVEKAGVRADFRGRA